MGRLIGLILVGKFEDQRFGGKPANGKQQHDHDNDLTYTQNDNQSEHKLHSPPSHLHRFDI